MCVYCARARECACACVCVCALRTRVCVYAFVRARDHIVRLCAISLPSNICRFAFHRSMLNPINNCCRRQRRTSSFYMSPAALTKTDGSEPPGSGLREEVDVCLPLLTCCHSTHMETMFDQAGTLPQRTSAPLFRQKGAESSWTSKTSVR